MYIIGPREVERYFLRTLLLGRPGLTSFKNASTVGGIQYSSFREACCAMGLLADDAEWMRCLKDTFESTFEPLTTSFATIIALCEPSSPIGLWEKNLTNILIDMRRRYISTPEAVCYLEADDEVKEYAMEEVQSYLKAINERLSVEDFGLKRKAGNEPLLPKTNEDHQKSVPETQNEIELAIKNFNDGQKAVFKSSVGEILPGVTATTHSLLYQIKNKPIQRNIEVSYLRRLEEQEKRSLCVMSSPFLNCDVENLSSSLLPLLHLPSYKLFALNIPCLKYQSLAILNVYVTYQWSQL